MFCIFAFIGFEETYRLLGSIGRSTLGWMGLAPCCLLGLVGRGTLRLSPNYLDFVGIIVGNPRVGNNFLLHNRLDLRSSHRRRTTRGALFGLVCWAHGPPLGLTSKPKYVMPNMFIQGRLVPHPPTTAKPRENNSHSNVPTPLKLCTSNVC